MEVKTKIGSVDFEQVFVPENEVTLQPGEGEGETPSVLQPDRGSIAESADHYFEKTAATCVICCETFRELNEFNKHVRREESCKFCPATFCDLDNVATLRGHVRSDHGSNFPRCDRCKELFSNETEIAEHRVGSNKCRSKSQVSKHCKCHKSVSVEEEKLEIHIDKGNCLKVNGEVLKSQITKHQELNSIDYELLKPSILSKVLASNIIKKKVFMVFCMNCLKDFKYNYYVSTHLSKCSQRPDFTCPFCTLIKDSIKEDINQHIYQHLKQNTSLPECSLCHTTFLNDINWSMHTTKVHPCLLLGKQTPSLDTNESSSQSECNSSIKPDVVNQEMLEKEIPLLSSLKRKLTCSIQTSKPLSPSIPQSPTNNDDRWQVTTHKIATPSKPELSSLPEQSVITEHVKVKSSTRSGSKIKAEVAISRLGPSTLQKTKNKVKQSSGSYTCKLCNADIPKQEYIGHMNSHCFKCPHCNQLFYSQLHILTHLGLPSKSETTMYEYTITEPSILDQIKLKPQCILYHHAIYAPGFPTITEVSKENECSVCFLQFKFPCQLVKHQATSCHDLQILKCEHCGHKFGTEVLFHRHSCPVKLIKCQQCDFVCSTVSDLLKHLNIRHSDKVDWECTFCYKEKKNESNLHKHVNKHHLNGECYCKLCLKTFTTKLEFDMHRYRFHGIKLKCCNCKAQFSNKYFLKQHIETCS